MCLLDGISNKYVSIIFLIRNFENVDKIYLLTKKSRLISESGFLYNLLTAEC